jgi:hypothetical protein
LVHGVRAKDAIERARMDTFWRDLTLAKNLTQTVLCIFRHEQAVDFAVRVEECGLDSMYAKEPDDPVFALGPAVA